MIRSLSDAMTSSLSLIKVLLYFHKFVEIFTILKTLFASIWDPTIFKICRATNLA
jgi:hypothetical protein